MVPDYTTDLNAIHAAVATLTTDEKMLFQNCVFMGMLSNLHSPSPIMLLELEALPRCQAFLKTKGKWTE
jgi:hypothetical protein